MADERRAVGHQLSEVGRVESFHTARIDRVFQRVHGVTVAHHVVAAAILVGLRTRQAQVDLTHFDCHGALLFRAGRCGAEVVELLDGVLAGELAAERIVQRLTEACVCIEAATETTEGIVCVEHCCFL